MVVSPFNLVKESFTILYIGGPLLKQPNSRDFSKVHDDICDQPLTLKKTVVTPKINNYQKWEASNFVFLICLS